MRYWQIRVGKKHLYFYYCEVIIMQVNSENSIRLNSTLYVSELEVNFFLKKQICKMKLHKNFNHHCLQMCDKCDKTIIEMSE